MEMTGVPPTSLGKERKAVSWLRLGGDMSSVCCRRAGSSLWAWSLCTVTQPFLQAVSV